MCKSFQCSKRISQHAIKFHNIRYKVCKHRSKQITPLIILLFSRLGRCQDSQFPHDDVKSCIHLISETIHNVIGVRPPPMTHSFPLSTARNKIILKKHHSVLFTQTCRHAAQIHFLDSLPCCLRERVSVLCTIKIRSLPKNKHTEQA